MRPNAVFRFTICGSAFVQRCRTRCLECLACERMLDELAFKFGGTRENWAFCFKKRGSLSQAHQKLAQLYTQRHGECVGLWLYLFAYMGGIDNMEKELVY